MILMETNEIFLWKRIENEKPLPKIPCMVSKFLVEQVSRSSIRLYKSEKAMKLEKVNDSYFWKEINSEIILPLSPDDLWSYIN